MRYGAMTLRHRRFQASVWATAGALAAFAITTIVFGATPTAGVPEAAVSTAIRLVLIPVGSTIGWILGYRR